MIKLDGTVIFSAVAAALAVILPAFVGDEFEFAAPARDGLALMLFSLVATPVAFALPRLRAGIFGRAWQVPSTTYILPRWEMRLGVGGIVGLVAGFAVAAISKDYRILWLAGSLSLVGGAFCVGAWPRLSKGAPPEFTMQMFGWNRMIKGLRDALPPSKLPEIQVDDENSSNSHERQ